jgi:hypothetical protein
MQEFIGADYRLIRNSPAQRRRAILQNRLAIESMRARRGHASVECMHGEAPAR